MIVSLTPDKLLTGYTISSASWAKKLSRLQRLRLIDGLTASASWCMTPTILWVDGWRVFPIRHLCGTWRRHRNGNATASRSVRTAESRMDVIYRRAEYCDDVGTSW